MEKGAIVQKRAKERSFESSGKPVNKGSGSIPAGHSSQHNRLVSDQHQVVFSYHKETILCQFQNQHQLQEDLSIKRDRIKTSRRIHETGAHRKFSCNFFQIEC